MRRVIFNPNRNLTRALPGNAGYASALQVDEKGEYRAYNQTTDIVNEGGPVTVVDGCFALMFTNTGLDVCYVNGKKLFPGGTVLPLTRLGDSFAISGHLRDLYYGVINVKFETNTGPALEIVQVFYTGLLKDKNKKDSE